MFTSPSTRRSSSTTSAALTAAKNENETMMNPDETKNTTVLDTRKVGRSGKTMMMKNRRKRRHRNLVLVMIITIMVFMAFFFLAIGILLHSKIDSSNTNSLYNNQIHDINRGSDSNRIIDTVGMNDIYAIDKNEKSHNLRGDADDAKRNIWVSEDSIPFNKNGMAVNADHLIMVAGHSVTVSGHLQDSDSDEKDWFLLEYQKGQGLPQAIHAHIKAGIDEALNDSKSLLIFSGGETRDVSGPQTEAQAYYHVADAMNLWQNDGGASVRARTTTEEFATDSFENFMFSICRFYEVTGSYPKKITIVSFSFKRRRFETLHAPALRWPADKFRYIGVDPPLYTGFNLQRSTEGEMNNAAAPFEKDPYGCHSDVLVEKRKSRNPFRRTPPYKLSCPGMRNLLEFCGPELIPLNQVPWD